MQDQPSTKHCSACDRDKSLACFGQNRYANDGLQWVCRDCINARSRERYYKDLEATRRATRAQRKKQRERNPPRFYRIDLRGRRFGKLTVVEYTKKERPDGKGKWICRCDCGNTTEVLYSNLTRGEHTTSCGCKIAKPLPDDSSAKNELYCGRRYMAADKGLEFDLLFDEFAQLITAPCAYCGAPPSKAYKPWHRRFKRRSFYTNGIDRVDNTKGYVCGNCAPCCRRCNVAKNNMSYQDFRSWVKRVYRHMFGKQTKAEIETAQLSLVG